MDFEQYFSFDDIVKVLCALRTRIASSRHRYHMYWDRLVLHDDAGKELEPKSKISEESITKMLPPRRLWRRGGKEARKGLSQNDVATLSIIRVISGMLKAGKLKDSQWGRNLVAFAMDIQKTITIGEFAFRRPELMLIRKNTGRVKTMDEENKKSSYRCLSCFTDSKDRVILSKTAAYLRNVFDSHLLNCCYAFRRNGKKYSIHTAINNLIEYRKRFTNQTLYVADCDIQKFFDVINHDIIRRAFDIFSARAPQGVDNRARKVLEAYLNVYAFPRNLDEYEDPEIIAKRECVDRVPISVLQSVYGDEDVNPHEIGIPQGGALSPLLANIVMDEADRAVMADADENLFYARFCDDIIIVHPEKKKCKEALDRYLDAVKRLKLPTHPIAKSARYSSAYFTEKSKGPIAWKETGLGRPGTPWISFLGHQIRYDGAVRIKKETIKKHQDKMYMEKTRLTRMLKDAQSQFRNGFTWYDLFKVFQLRLTAIGVGRIDRPANARFARSWLAVFLPHISSCPSVVSQLKNLDRTRNSVLKLAKKAMKREWRKQHPATPAIDCDNGNKDLSVNDSTTLTIKRGYYGAPFSYYGSFKGLTRVEIQDYYCKEKSGSNFGIYGDL
ncbi:MAG: group II intron reverse transcriptase domain-containing protein [Kiritimatiellae bacterium]|nr:group II intron reverse transcriptase domain-containing protein [Kiritimatiellia bacterium]